MHTKESVRQLADDRSASCAHSSQRPRTLCHTMRQLRNWGCLRTCTGKVNTLAARRRKRELCLPRRLLMNTLLGNAFRPMGRFRRGSLQGLRPCKKNLAQKLENDHEGSPTSPDGHGCLDLEGRGIREHTENIRRLTYALQNKIVFCCRTPRGWKEDGRFHNEVRPAGSNCSHATARNVPCSPAPAQASLGAALLPGLAAAPAGAEPTTKSSSLPEAMVA